MNLCDDGHEEVCYEGRNCPACEFKVKLEILEDENEDMKKRVDELEEDIKGIEAE